MNDAARIPPFGDFDNSWRRLPWIAAAALIIWALLLGAFARLLEYASPPPPPATIDARLIELPPAAGLQGGHAPAPVAKPQPRPQPIHKRPLAIHHRSVEHRLARRPAPHRESAAPEAEHAPPAPSKPTSGGSGTGAGPGVGGDAGGARAIYAPMPTIPDDMREDALNTVAVAAFKVAVDGSAEVTLVKPTAIPRLNYLLLSTLKEWRFFPAIKNGQPVASQFELRIPITIQ
jgi:protein TonB